MFISRNVRQIETELFALVTNAYALLMQAAELESIQMQHRLDALKEEKERLLNSLIEAE